MEFFLRAGHRHIEHAAFLLAFFSGAGFPVRHHAFVHVENKHHREFQALGRVEGHKLHLSVFRTEQRPGGCPSVLRPGGSTSILRPGGSASLLQEVLTELLCVGEPLLGKPESLRGFLHLVQDLLKLRFLDEVRLSVFPQEGVIADLLP